MERKCQKKHPDNVVTKGVILPQDYGDPEKASEYNSTPASHLMIKKCTVIIWPETPPPKTNQKRKLPIAG